MKNLLKNRRVQLGMTQKLLAETLSVSQQTVARWEATDDIPTKHLKDVAVKLGIKISDFFSDTAQVKSVPSMSLPEGPFGGLWITIGGHDVCYPTGWSQVDKLFTRLRDGISKSNCWVQFNTVDYRVVFLNASAVECIRWVDDAQEEMPSFEHEEVYKAAGDIVCNYSFNSANPDGPYTEVMISAVDALIEDKGGEEGAFSWLHNANYVTRSGNPGVAVVTDSLAFLIDSGLITRGDSVEFLDLASNDESVKLMPIDSLGLIDLPYFECLKILNNLYPDE